MAARKAVPADAGTEPSPITQFDPQDPAFSDNVLRLWQEHLPDVDASGIPLFVLANAVMLRFKAWQAEVLGTCGVNLSDFQILSTLYLTAGGELTSSELRTILWLTPGGMTRTIKRMVEAGLLETRTCDNDKRRNPVRLTRLGRRRAREISAKVANFYSDAIAGLKRSDEERIIEGMLLFLREVRTG